MLSFYNIKINIQTRIYKNIYSVCHARVGSKPTISHNGQIFWGRWGWGRGVTTYPSPETRWTGWRSQRRSAGSCWASYGACSCRTARRRTWPPTRPLGSSGRTSAGASWSAPASATSSASWRKAAQAQTERHKESLRVIQLEKARVLRSRAAFPSLTYGPANSKTLLMVCLSTIMMAIWMKRSVRQPLGWHCKGWRGNVFEHKPQYIQKKQASYCKRLLVTHLLQPPLPGDTDITPRMAVYPVGH